VHIDNRDTDYLVYLGLNPNQASNGSGKAVCTVVVDC